MISREGKKRLTRISEIKLDSLLEVTKAINSNYSIDMLLEIFKGILENKLQIPKLMLFISSEDDWKCWLKSGVGEEYKGIVVERDLLHIREINAVNFSENTPLNFSESNNENLLEIVIPVYHKTQPLAYLMIGDADDSKEVIRPSIKHLNFVQTLTSIIVVAIENKKLAKQSIRQIEVKRELELASIMQNMLFPTGLPQNDKIDSAAFYLPHRQVGGDYYDYVEINDNEFAFCVADVSGKGVAAAFVMSNFQAQLRILLKHTSSLTELVKELNVNVMASAKGEKFITLFVAKYNLVTRKLNYINAAHNPPILLHDGNVTTLNEGCIGLGMFDEISDIESAEITIEPNTKIVCYTDGLTELENGAGEEFGVENLKDVVLANRNEGMQSLNRAIMDAVDLYKGKKPYVDDIALLSLKIM